MRAPLHARRRQRGAALIIGLILLMVLTILAFASVNTATTELAMSGNEQFRQKAAQAASAGIETAIPDLGDVSTVPGSAPLVSALTAVPGQPEDRFQTRSRFIGEERGLPQSSADRFVGYQFEIESTGTSARNARDVQTQGVMVVVNAGSSGGEANFGRLGGGLQ